jgi:hypothetical protein
MSSMGRTPLSNPAAFRRLSPTEVQKLTLFETKTHILSDFARLRLHEPYQRRRQRLKLAD